MIALFTAWLFIMKYSTRFHSLSDYYPLASRMNLLDLLGFVDYFLISKFCPVVIPLLQDRNIFIKCCILFRRLVRYSHWMHLWWKVLPYWSWTVAGIWPHHRPLALGQTYTRVFWRRSSLQSNNSGDSLLMEGSKLLLPQWPGRTLQPRHPTWTARTLPYKLWGLAGG